MRNALLSLLVAAIALPAAALAARAGPGDGTLSVEGGSGMVTVQARGGVIGRVERGTLTITDLTPGDGNDAVVQGALLQRPAGPGTMVYKGRNVTFRLIGGSFRVQVVGKGISLSAVGQGIAVLDGDGPAPGVFSTAGDDCKLAPDSCRPLPPLPVRIRFGGPDRPGPGQVPGPGPGQGPGPAPNERQPQQVQP